MNNAVDVFSLFLNEVQDLGIRLKIRLIVNKGTDAFADLASEELPCSCEHALRFSLTTRSRDNNGEHVKLAENIAVGIEPASVKELLKEPADPEPFDTGHKYHTVGFLQGVDHHRDRTLILVEVVPFNMNTNLVKHSRELVHNIKRGIFDQTSAAVINVDIHPCSPG